MQSKYNLWHLSCILLSYWLLNRRAVEDHCTVTYRQTEQQETGRVNTSLHGYQKRLLECVGKGGNHIIVAPTGSGKTRVAVDLPA